MGLATSVGVSGCEEITWCQPGMADVANNIGSYHSGANAPTQLPGCMRAHLSKLIGCWFSGHAPYSVEADLSPRHGCFKRGTVFVSLPVGEKSLTVRALTLFSQFVNNVYFEANKHILKLKSRPIALWENVWKVCGSE